MRYVTMVNCLLVVLAFCIPLEHTVSQNKVRFLVLLFRIHSTDTTLYHDQSMLSDRRYLKSTITSCVRHDMSRSLRKPSSKLNVFVTKLNFHLLQENTKASILTCFDDSRLSQYQFGRSHYWHLPFEIVRMRTWHCTALRDDYTSL